MSTMTIERVNAELRAVTWDDEPTVVQAREHVTEREPLLGRAVEWLATRGTVLATGALVVSALVTMGAR